MLKIYVNIGVIDMQDNNKAVEIYKEILEGKRRRFPKNFFKEKSKEKADAIFKYLFEEKLQWSIEQVIEKLDCPLITEYRLTTIFNRYYGRNIGVLIKSIYPNSFKGKRRPMQKVTKERISLAQKNLSTEKRQNITNGTRRIRNCKQYIKKLSDTKAGELNPQHKLKAEQVVEIRRLWTTKIYTTTTLGEKFGVGRQTIADIVYGRTWKHI